MRHSFRRTMAPIAGAAALVAALGAPALAHEATNVGDFHVEVGWLVEPAYVGAPNAVQVTITDHDDKAVNDLTPDDLAVVVSTGTSTSPELEFEAAFDAEELVGRLGEYDAAIVPTAPGDYTFHLIGSIHGTKLDLTLTSGEETFDPVKESADLEFPAKLPSMAEVTTRLDRIDGRIAELQAQAGGPTGPTVAEVEAARAAAADARAAASGALIAGLGMGGLGIVVGVVGVLLAIRAGRRPVA